MNITSPFPRHSVWALLLSVTCLVVLEPLSSICGQETSKPFLVSGRIQNFIVLVVGYEMDKARADAILQTQDMTIDAKILVEKLEGLAKVRAATHVSCAAQAIRSGLKIEVIAGTVVFEFDKVMVSPTGDNLSVVISRSDISSGISSTINASFVPGGFAFIGTVPDAKPGKDQLLFARCLVHYP